MDKLVKTKTGDWQLVQGASRQSVPDPSLQKISIVHKKPVAPTDIENILAQVGLPSMSPQTRQRLRQTVRLYQQGVRNIIDTRILLERSTSEGGFGLSEQIVDQLFKVILPVKSSPIVSHNTSNGSVVNPQRAEKLANALSQVRPVEVVEVEQKAETPPMSSPSAVQTQKVVTDVKSYPKVVGPIEELRILTIKDMRRFSTIPKKALEVVKNKLELLRDDSYEDYMKGVVAWRQSPLNQRYLRLVEDSLHSASVSLAEVVAKARQADLESLSWEEFVAIREFNSTL